MQELNWTEIERLGDVHATGLLDTPAEQRFDRLTALAARVAGTPVALITLLDDARQYFKSAHGVEITETPRDIAFCNVALRLDNTLVVEDARADPMFANNPLVTGSLGIRFYAGIIIRSPYGRPLGTLCVIDREPRTLDDATRVHLEHLAAMVEECIAEGFDDAHTPTTTDSGEAATPLARDIWSLMAQRVAGADANGVVVIRTTVRDVDRNDAPAGPSARVLAPYVGSLRRALDDNCLCASTIDDDLIIIGDAVPLTSAGEEVSTTAAALVRRVHQAIEAARFAETGVADLTPVSGVARGGADDTLHGLIAMAGIAARDALAETTPQRFAIFDGKTQERRSREATLRTALRDAIRDDALDVLLQPIVAVADARIIGAEALCRWPDGPGGAVTPAEFIPLAERVDLIRPLSERVLDHVFASAARLMTHTQTRLRLSINLPGSLLADDDFVASIIQRRPSDMRWVLAIEITEHTFFTAAGRVQANIDALESAGVHVLIDDFGSGHNSLNQLAHMPVSGVKLDRVFVRRIASSRADSTIIRGLIAMCRTLSLPVTAEGVEHLDQLLLLRHFGATYAQGYLFDPALDVASFVRRLSDGGSYGMPLLAQGSAPL